jgi:hypothetical protein
MAAQSRPCSRSAAIAIQDYSLKLTCYNITAFVIKTIVSNHPQESFTVRISKKKKINMQKYQQHLNFSGFRWEMVWI